MAVREWMRVERGATHMGRGRGMMMGGMTTTPTPPANTPSLALVVSAMVVSCLS